jgi:hypothetical protein
MHCLCIEKREMKALAEIMFLMQYIDVPQIPEAETALKIRSHFNCVIY